MNCVLHLLRSGPFEHFFSILFWEHWPLFAKGLKCKRFLQCCHYCNNSWGQTAGRHNIKPTDQKKVLAITHCGQMRTAIPCCPICGRVKETQGGVGLYALTLVCLMFNQPPSVTNSAKTDAVTLGCKELASLSQVWCRNVIKKTWVHQLDTLSWPFPISSMQVFA